MAQHKITIKTGPYEDVEIVESAQEALDRVMMLTDFIELDVEEDHEFAEQFDYEWKALQHTLDTFPGTDLKDVTLHYIGTSFHIEAA